jgi:hypothetical protein
MGVMQALISFVQVSQDSLRVVITGEHKIVFVVREHLILVGVTKGADSTQQMVLQLSYVYNQVLSVLTFSTLHKVFKQRRNYDLRRLLSGAEKFIDSLLNMMDSEPSFMLGAVRCLPLDSAIREMIAQSIVQHARVRVRIVTEHRARVRVRIVTEHRARVRVRIVTEQHARVRVRIVTEHRATCKSPGTYSHRASCNMQESGYV